MTLAASTNFTVFDGDGVTTLIPFSFPIDTIDGSDLQPYYVDSAGTVTQLTSNYTVDIPNSRINYPTVGGVSPLGISDNAVQVGSKIVLLRIEPLSQNVALAEQGAFSADAIEAEFDKITMILQQLQEQLNRCVKYPVGTTPSSTDVNAFIAAVSAVIMPPPITGTYAYLKSIAATTPTTVRFAFATDLGTGSVLMFYGGDTSVGDQGWFGPLAGGA